MISAADERFLHFAVLESIASESRLNRRLILRSAAAIRHFYGGPRRTSDLDFVLVRMEAHEDSIEEPAYTRSMLNARLNQRLPLHYPDYAARQTWLSQELKIEISPCSEPIECRAFEIVPGSGDSILTSTLEDALAVKLVAMIDYHAGGKLRERDLFDVAEVLGRPGAPVDIVRLAELTRAKAERRGYSMTADLYSEAVRCRLSLRYHTIRDLTGEAFIPIEDAWARLRQFVACFDGTSLTL